MIAYPGYRLLEPLHTGKSSLVFRAEPSPATPETATVILKVLNHSTPTAQDIGRLRREYAILRRFDHPGIVRPLALSHSGGHWLMVLEDLPGEALARLLHQQDRGNGAPAIALDKFFAIAVQLCDALAAIHSAGIIHKDINPSNLIWHEQRQQLQIIDFGIASELARESQTAQSPDLIEGTLAYISPEQTGRMNRVIDFRSDYYSLGVTLYELLCGRRPFESHDAMELVHCHIARRPDWERPVFARVPAQMLALLQRLLEKSAEHRYQTLHGLRKDLEACRILAKGGTPPVEAGLGYHSGVLRIPQKLYGRGQQVGALLAAFEQAAKGHSEMILVAGYSGIGKSAVIGEVHKPIVARRGYFLSGKCDQYKRNSPYSALIQAFQELIRQLLTESAAQVELWAAKLKQALGTQAGVIAELIPELRLLLGEIEPLEVLPPAEAQNRLHRLFQRFVQLFAAEAHPLVLFLDDLQWADAPTLKLIELFMRDPDQHFMLIIGAYRDNEVDPSHPLLALRDVLLKAEVRVQTLTLAALAETDVEALIADALDTQPESCRALAALCMRKTAGNPFFLGQFLTAIHEDGYLSFDFASNAWTWQIETLEQAEFADNVVELMLSRINRLPETTRDLLQMAASLGNRFDLATLARVEAYSPYHAKQTLWPALAADLIRPLDAAYKYLDEQSSVAKLQFRFLHDRVQQAAYGTVPDQDKQQRHLRIGRRLLLDSTEAERDEQLFNIVDQFNAGRALLQNTDERLELARLNLRAGLKARASAAYLAAFEHMQIGLSLLPERSWHNAFELTRDLQLGRAEAAYLCGDFGSADAAYREILAHCSDVQDRVRCHVVQIEQYQLQARFPEAIETQRQGLALLQVNIPDDEAALQTVLAEELATVQGLLADRSLADIMTAPEMDSAEDIAAMRLLLGLHYAGYLAGRPTLVAVADVIMTRISLTKGTNDLSAPAFVCYAFIAGQLLKQYQFGFAFGAMALELSNQRSNLSIRCKTYFLFTCLIHHWHRPLSESSRYYDDIVRWSLEIGDLVNAGYSVVTQSSDGLIQGTYLPELLANTERDIHVPGRAGHLDMVDCTLVGAVQPIKNLMGLTASADSFDDTDAEGFKEARYLAAYAHFQPMLSYYYQSKLRNAYLFATDQAEAMAGKLDFILHNSIGLSKTHDAAFYATLTWLRLLRRAPERSDGPALLERIRQQQQNFAVWETLCADTFLAKHRLLQAEIARGQGDVANALSRYREAIAQARATGCVNLEALANELCGEFWQEQGEERVAQVFLREALHLYRAWGAEAKVEQLQARYLWLRAHTPRSPFPERPSTSTRTVSLDLAGIVKASQALSSAVGLRPVLERLMRIVQENAGAQNARLLLRDGEQWLLEADLAHDCAELLQAEPVPLNADDHALFPLTVLRYVARTGAEVVEESLRDSPAFAGDPYVRREQPQSMLCLPIKREGQIGGLLYLENNLAAGAFTHERIEFLRVLVAQALISIDNARLYASLEDKVSERTLALKAAVAELKTKNEQVESTLDELKRTQVQLVQQGKMAGLGTLTAGVAHEINNPVNFAHVGAEGLKLEIQRFRAFLLELAGDDAPPEIMASLNGRVDGLLEQLATVTEGTTRIRDLVKDLRTFSRLDEAEKKTVNILDSLRSTLSLVRMQYADIADVRCEFAAEPVLECWPAQLNQVFMNLIVNACQAIETRRKNTGASDRGLLSIRSRSENSALVLEFEDNGCGIPAAELDRIFEPFFTTKAVNEGSGLGLSIAFGIIEKHRGTLHVRSTVGLGTTFTLSLPLNGAATAQATSA